LSILRFRSEIPEAAERAVKKCTIRSASAISLVSEEHRWVRFAGSIFSFLKKGGALFQGLASTSRA
jgi:hypothetical protein